jgi:hypothetical protein
MRSAGRRFVAPSLTHLEAAICLHTGSSTRVVAHTCDERPGFLCVCVISLFKVAVRIVKKFIVFHTLLESDGIFVPSSPLRYITV